MPALSHPLRFFLGSALVGLAIAFGVVLLRPELAQSLRSRLGVATPTANPEQVPQGPTAVQGPVSYAAAVNRAAPSVVSVYTARVVTSIQLLPGSFNPQLTGMIGVPRRRLERALGSGVIVSSDGYVLTNHHVIANADEVQLVLQDGRTTKARIVGSDEDTDLAVLKVDGADLPAMPLDQEAPLAVGDVVLAIGNPFGLSQTVTLGIVSGLSRKQLNLSTYDDFIQTDAAINAGNSGGALINARGELIGINTFVLGRTEGIASAEGIGFAIPLSAVRHVFQQIVQNGVVIRGWLGAEYDEAPILPGALEAGSPRGVALTLVYQGGPADLAGLRPGDVLVRVDGRDIDDQAELREREAAADPGATVALEGWRSGVPFKADVVLTQRPPRRSS